MKKLILLITVLIMACENSDVASVELTTKFEKTNGTETTTYSETLDYFRLLESKYPEIKMMEIGETDSGFPLHLVIYDESLKFNFQDSDLKNTVLINNAIHPGEPDGVDASMMLLRDIAQNKILTDELSNTVLAFIPIYNIGGALNRNSDSRANQNGPKEYGFRGNARNFDLNRDFIKADTKNARSFAKIYHLVQPDVFIDNHVSNGADYQYAITHLFTQHNKLGNDMGIFMNEEMQPALEASLLEKNIPITPYVNVWGSTPDKGFSQFFDGPRYSSGYTTLFNSFGMMVETHMLKPYKIRVEQTYELMESLIRFSADNTAKIKELRKNALAQILDKENYPISFELDRSKFTTFEFKGYEGEYRDSKVTSGRRLFYDREKPYSKSIKYYNQFTPKNEIRIPKAYILKNGWWPVMERLNDNKINYQVFEKDTLMSVDMQALISYDTRSSAYEGHYLHYNTVVNSIPTEVEFKKGDVFIPVDQPGARYIMETLEAAAPDSFFNWNFFDTVLQQKEGYSAYVFEDLAEEFLNENPVVKDSLKYKMKTDPDFSKNPRAQLNYIYKRSPHYEPSHLKLPVYKVF